jgi:uncharacterized membrane protein (UPF0136 family)
MNRSGLFWKKKSLFIFLIYLFSVLFYFLVLFNNNNIFINTASLYVRYKPHISFPIFSILFFVSLTIRHARSRQAVAFFLVVLLFSLTISGVWSSAKTEQYLISGLVPFSDARFQFSGTLKLLETGELNGTTSRRPISAIVIALIFALSRYNLQLTLAWWP